MILEKPRAAFLQGGERESAALLNEVVRASVRKTFWHVMAAEVEALCGRRYAPDRESGYRRAGSERGSVYLGEEEGKLVRPRVRHETEGEVQLESYRVGGAGNSLVQGVTTQGHRNEGKGHLLPARPARNRAAMAGIESVAAV